MTMDASLWEYVANAGIVVKVVMLILLAASVTSWTIIFQRVAFLKKTRTDVNDFEDQFWSGVELQKLYKQLPDYENGRNGLQNVFYAGFGEFSRLAQKPGLTPAAVMEGSERAMHVAKSRELEKLESHLSFLATVGSTSPYVGLFGTVWGIMTSFHALTNVSQATISMVAPGISEALIATAMGLFAAIPAVIAYNRFSNDVERLVNRYDTFQEEFSSILHRQSYGDE